MKGDFLFMKRKRKSKVFGENKMMQEATKKYDSYVEFRKREQFLKLPYRCLDVIVSIKDAFPLYLYMCDNITRGKSRSNWWNENVLPFYKKGYLPFAKHQKFMAKDLSLIQSSISRHITILEDNFMIVPLGRLVYSDKSSMIVYSLGKWFRNPKYEEVYYLQSLNFMEPIQKHEN